MLLQLQRGVQNRRDGLMRFTQVREREGKFLLAESVTPLWTDPRPSELWYQRGKIQNLRLAASCIHLCVIPAGQVFSFWQQVGRATARKGYAPGRMLQEGCMIPAIGGGLCQLSNALYQVALDAGCEIVERHPHSRVVPGSATAAKRDATVAWNYIDLRFRAVRAIRITVKLTATELHVALHALGAVATAAEADRDQGSSRVGALPILGDRACETCGQVSCFRSAHAPAGLRSKPVTAFLLDAAWPEFANYLRTHHSNHDTLAIPIDGQRWRLPQYAWPTEEFARCNTATLTTLLRAYRSRRMAAQGALRQQQLLEGARALARQLSAGLSVDVDEVCVSQPLLPFLWISGVLGGRRIRVLAERLPVSALQAELNRASHMHPESGTLHDFRADPWLMEAEDEALDHAEQIITPHAWIAKQFPGKALLLDWAIPANVPARQHQPGAARPTVLFPCSTLGRKGAYELREALNGMDVKLLLGGRVLEDEGFWNGFDVGNFSATTLDQVDVVIQPCVVESQPRTLLRALSACIPVITTPNSGLHTGSGARFIPALDAGTLRAAIETQLASTAELQEQNW